MEEGRWLQVSPHQSPEVTSEYQDPKYTVYQQPEYNEQPKYAAYQQPDYNAQPSSAPLGKKESSGLICGLRRVTFWLLVALAVVIIAAAAVGGGVGGALASQSSNSKDSGSPKNSPQSPTNTPHPASSPTPSSSTTYVSPTASPPTGCSKTTSGDFRLWETNITTQQHFYTESWNLEGATVFNLSGGVLVGHGGLTGVIADNGAIGSFALNDPNFPDIVKYTAGFSVCNNGSFGFGGSVVWYSCLREKSGNYFYFDQPQSGTTCFPFLFDATVQVGSSSAAVASPTAAVRLRV